MRPLLHPGISYPYVLQQHHTRYLVPGTLVYTCAIGVRSVQPASTFNPINLWYFFRPLTGVIERLHNCSVSFWRVRLVTRSKRSAHTVVRLNAQDRITCYSYCCTCKASYSSSLPQYVVHTLQCTVFPTESHTFSRTNSSRYEHTSMSPTSEDFSFYFSFFFKSSLSLSSSTRRTFYPQRSSGQAVVTGVVASSPRYLPSIFIAHRIQHSHCSSIFIECCY